MIDFSPGQRQMFEGGRVTRPYGTFSAYSWQTNANYIDALKNDPSVEFNYDYAAIFFDTSFSSVDIITYMPLVFNIAATGPINLAGYPEDVQGEMDSYAMWFSPGSGLSNTARIVYHDADTSGGNSGSPIWEYLTDTSSRRIVAIHAFGGFPSNGGTRLVNQNQALIESWMEWTPPPPPAPPDSSSDGGGGCFIATAAYGSYLDPHVQVLRDFRDRYLLNYKLGQKLVKLYYQKSPPIAETIAANEVLRLMTRWCLMPVIGIAYLTVSFGIITTLIIITIGVLMLVLISWLPIVHFNSNYRYGLIT
jgi:hypothetical protein